jgi:uncharacterized protein (TIGR02246 family)
MGKPSVEDWIGINALFTRYAIALDEGDVDTVVSCFTKDGVVDSPIMDTFSGHAAIREFAERNARLRQIGTQMRHVVSNVQADVEGDRATAICYLTNYVTKDGKSELVAPGVYNCRLIKHNGEWIFTYRHVTLDRPAKIEGR